MHANLHSEFLQSVSNDSNTRSTTRRNNHTVIRNNKSLITNLSVKKPASVNDRVKSNQEKERLSRKNFTNHQRTTKIPDVSRKVSKATSVTSPKTIASKPKEGSSQDTIKTKRTKLVSPKASAVMPSSDKNAFVLSAKKNTHINRKQKEHEINSRVKTIQRVPLTYRQSNINNLQLEKKFETITQSKGLKSTARENGNLKRASNRPLVHCNMQQSGKDKSPEVLDDTSLIRMATIKEEEFKDEHISGSMVNKDSIGNVQILPEQGDLRSLSKKSAAEETFTNSRPTTPNIKELYQLQQIEKDFVAFLLPWLKLVPNSSRDRRNKLDNEQKKVNMEDKNQRRLDGYLSNLSKVCDKN